MLVGLCPAAVTEDQENDITSAAVELTVPEEEVALGSSLKRIDLSRNAELAELDLSGCPDLRRCGCHENHLTKLDITGCLKTVGFISYCSRL